MKGVLLKKLIGLGRDEDGAALIITLALFMFLYAACAGVFAIGQTVKDKIHLQNACDAAAYSAAVVQADTLSRIATINRAMSWTYVSMTRRQMDYIVARWLEHIVSHYKEDRENAEKWYQEGTHCSKHSGWDISTILLNGHEPVTVEMIKNAVDAFPSHVDGQKESFFAVPSALAEQIVQDKVAISNMNDAVTTLAKELPKREVRAAQEVLQANVSKSDFGRCRWKISHNPDVIAGREYRDYSSGGYLRDLHSEELEEDLFVSYSTGNGARTSFERGTGFKESASHFFSYGNGSSDTYGSVGIQRAYRKTGGASDKLYAEWSWWSTKSGCVCPPSRVPLCIPYATGCGHSCHSDCACGLGVNTWDEIFLDQVASKSAAGCLVVQRSVRMHGDVQAIYDPKTYIGARAKPLVLRPCYFGSSGTITVGLAKYNENPWTMVFRKVTGYMADGDRSHGIYGLFNPYRYVEWSWAISSAKAGFQYHSADKDGRDRKYRVNYDVDNEKEWNLCTSDWDAVFVPVRKSHAFAGADKTWNSAGSDFLKDFVEGDWEPLDGSSSAPTYNIVGNMPNLPLMHNGGGVYRNLNWSRLADLMFH